MKKERILWLALALNAEVIGVAGDEAFSETLSHCNFRRLWVI